MLLRLVVAAAVVLALGLVWLAPGGLPAEAARAGAIGLVAISLWATGVFPIGLTAAIFFLLAVLVGQPPAVVFSGFHSSAFWLVFGGLVVAIAVQHTGLGGRLVQGVVRRLALSYPLVLSGVAVAALALAFVMPSSMGRIVLLMPLTLSLADRLGLAPGRPGRSGMVMVVALITFVSGGTILPGLLPGLVLAGSAETLFGVTISFADYLLVNFPVGGVLRSGLIVLVIWRLFPDDVERGEEVEPLAPASAAEWRLGAILLVALALWCTDTVHGISPGWIGLGAGILCLLPGLGLVPAKTLNERVDMNSVFYVGGVLGLGAVISQSGLAQEIGRIGLDVLPFGAGQFWDYAQLTLLSTVAGLAVTNPGVPVVLTPLADSLAGASGLPLKTVLMTQVLGFSNVILPYQASPVLVAMAMGGVPVRQGAKATLILSALGLLLLLPLTYAWWLWLGLFG
jgi:di/tricarboxylate transporter